MLQKATSIKDSSYLRGHFLTQTEERSDNRTSIPWLRAQFHLLLHCMRRTQLLRILIYEEVLESLGKLFQQWLFLSAQPLCSSPPPSNKQARISSTALWESILTPHCQQEPIHTQTLLPTHPPPSNSLFCSALLSLALAFSAKSQIGGWGVFCGPNKRAKVVRTPLYKSVWGGGGVGVESGVRRGGGAVTQTASLSGLGLHGLTGLGCSLATVTHGESELSPSERKGVMRDRVS